MKNSDLAQKLFYLSGRPFKMSPTDMRHLMPIYNSDSSSTLLKFGRQTHKSTTIGNNIMLPVIKMRNYHALYVAPTGNQVSVFSDDKLKNVSAESPLIEEYFTDTTTKDQVKYKEFSNGSKIYLRSCFQSPDGARGISADNCFFDEVQDLISDHISVISQSMSHSISKHHLMSEDYPNLPPHLYNCTWYAGTPKTVENTLERYWDKSTRCEWIITCSHCAKENYIDEASVGLLGLICRKCGKPIYYDTGRWIAMNPGASINGYRMPQVVVNWVNDRNNPRAWKTQVTDVRNVYSPEKFYNEVLALPYANARNPLSFQDILQCCDDKYNNMLAGPEQAVVNRAQTFYGIDWGKGDLANGTSYTVLTIGAIVDNKFTVLFMKKYTGKLSDSILQIADIYANIMLFNCKFGIGDYGDGRVSNAMMVQRVGPMRFAELYESNNLGKKIAWNGKTGHFTINRTQMMTDIFMAIKRGQVRFFNYTEFKEFSIDFLNVYFDYSEQTRLTKYDHVGADDCVHSYMYCRIACGIVTGELNKYLLGAESSPGRASAQEI